MGLFCFDLICYLIVIGFVAIFGFRVTISLFLGLHASLHFGLVLLVGWVLLFAVICGLFDLLFYCLLMFDDW